MGGIKISNCNCSTNSVTSEESVDIVLSYFSKSGPHLSVFLFEKITARYTDFCNMDIFSYSHASVMLHKSP